MESLIAQIRSKLESGKYPDEAAIKNGIVMPVLHKLGWDIFDIECVTPEYSIQGRRVDYALRFPPETPRIFVEVKQDGMINGAEKQLFEYASYLGVPLAILVDRRKWNFYLPTEQGTFQERKLCSVDLLNSNLQEITALLTKYLDYRRVINGEALREARKDFDDNKRQRETKKILPQAWEQLVQDGDELLVKLVADKVQLISNFRPDPESIIAFLNKLVIAKTDSAIPVATSHKSRVMPLTQFQPPDGPTSSYSFVLRGVSHYAPNARKLWIKLIQELDNYDPHFLERLSEYSGSQRRLVARNPEHINPHRPDLVPKQTVVVKPGWWLLIHFSKADIERNMKFACEVANLKYGKDMIVKIQK